MDTVWNIEESMASCTLCPRGCRADRLHGQRGRCGQDSDIVVARAALHPWEEPCISGTRGSGTVFFAGCPLGCIYCQNAQIAGSGKALTAAAAQRAAEGGGSRQREGMAGRVRQTGKTVSVGRLAGIFLELKEQGAHNINLVTPLHFAPQIAAALRLAKAAGLTLPVVCNCGGYERVETLKRMEGLVDIYLPDLKYIDSGLSAAFSQAPDYFEAAGAAIAEMVRQTGGLVLNREGILQRGVVVRHLVLPGHTKEAEAVVRYLLDTYGSQIAISLLNQYTPCVKQETYPELNRRLTRREYNKVVDYALDAGLENGYIQEGGTASESFIPPFDASGV